MSRFDELSRTTPVLANVKPSGSYLMEDFFYAGGLPAVLRELMPPLHREALTITGRSATTQLGQEEPARSAPM